MSRWYEEGKETSALLQRSNIPAATPKQRWNEERRTHRSSATVKPERNNEEICGGIKKRTVSPVQRKHVCDKNGAKPTGEERKPTQQRTVDTWDRRTKKKSKKRDGTASPNQEKGSCETKRAEQQKQRSARCNGREEHRRATDDKNDRGIYSCVRQGRG